MDTSYLDEIPQCLSYDYFKHEDPKTQRKNNEIAQYFELASL